MANTGSGSSNNVEMYGTSNNGCARNECLLLDVEPGPSSVSLFFPFHVIKFEDP